MAFILLLLHEAVLELLLLLEIITTAAELAALLIDSVRSQQASAAIRTRLVGVRNSLWVII